MIQRFWNWNKLDKSFYEQTQAMGDIHHFAWRAYHANQTVYLADGDVRKYVLCPQCCALARSVQP